MTSFVRKATDRRRDMYSFLMVYSFLLCDRVQKGIFLDKEVLGFAITTYFSSFYIMDMYDLCYGSQYYSNTGST